MVQAYILVQTEVGKAAEVAVRIGAISGVTQAEDVTGPYDVIVRAEAENVDDLGRLVVAQIQAVSGITRTLTCPIVHIYAEIGAGRLPRTRAYPGEGRQEHRQPPWRACAAAHDFGGAVGLPEP